MKPGDWYTDKSRGGSRNYCLFIFEKLPSESSVRYSTIGYFPMSYDYPIEWNLYNPVTLVGEGDYVKITPTRMNYYILFHRLFKNGIKKLSGSD